ncbi:hypothetical protein P170DRAFT_425767 [Aspergillus steynii IBT 23096]|uniref:Aminoglycoside phosphotransferase domain-containing protein n=1 Tax=Aspergillus steynii IBT 23096 TaxID=1392250 RepID=A0A2I2G793_9EURO|nr:uncharacterized protein P170DRAFT_425767 [Aspergillus steynii IBT 23096]PLB48743.1 hypothetical protein P170DRAFT_425767 [Aspergillus steynii IBT 23096]
MAHGTFFTDSWVHEYVDFKIPFRSRWTITQLISEYPHQQIVEHEEHDTEPKLSYSRATFLCRNARNPSQQAFLRVYMQIPHRGTEDEPDFVRSAQAGTRTHDDIEAMALFHNKRAKHLPRCLGMKEIKQDILGLVPGGYMSYLLWEMLPGIRLNEKRFWSFDKAERDAIREAFTPAYKELYGLGLKPLHCGPSHLLWDWAYDKIYIIGFGFMVPASADNTWEEKIHAAWGLAIPPEDGKWREMGCVPEATKGSEP